MCKYERIKKLVNQGKAVFIVAESNYTNQFKLRLITKNLCEYEIDLGYKSARFEFTQSCFNYEIIRQDLLRYNELRILSATETIKGMKRHDVFYGFKITHIEVIK